MIRPTNTERTPPSHLDAERGVIACALMDPRTLDDVAVIVRPEDFSFDGYGVIYARLLDMRNANKPIDLLLLADSLKAHRELDKAGGSKALVEIAESEATAVNASWYARIVRDKAILRELASASDETIRDTLASNADPMEVTAQAEARIFAVADRRTVTSDAKPIGDVLFASFQAIKDHKPGEFQGTPTGFYDLDRRLGGLRPGTLTILAARPSMGKSAFAGNIAMNVAFDYARTVLFVSLEMSYLEVGDRILSAHSGVPLADMRNVPSEDQRQMLVESMSELSQSKLLVDDSAGLTMTEIAAKCRRNKRKYGSLDLVVIDYLQLIEPDDKRRPREEQVSAISRHLKRLARELSVPVLCLAQLNRKTEDATGNRPRLSHLRESGAIEQDADVVLFIHRDEYYATTDREKEEAAGKALVITAKARQAQVGDDPLVWNAETCRFDSAVRDGYSKAPTQYTPPRSKATGKGPYNFD